MTEDCLSNKECLEEIIHSLKEIDQQYIYHTLAQDINIAIIEIFPCGF